jgi:hypothetical protein
VNVYDDSLGTFTTLMDLYLEVMNAFISWSSESISAQEFAKRIQHCLGDVVSITSTTFAPGDEDTDPQWSGHRQHMTIGDIPDGPLDTPAKAQSRVVPVRSWGPGRGRTGNHEAKEEGALVHLAFLHSQE